MTSPVWSRTCWASAVGGAAIAAVAARAAGVLEDIRCAPIRSQQRDLIAAVAQREAGLGAEQEQVGVGPDHDARGIVCKSWRRRRRSSRRDSRRSSRHCIARSIHGLRRNTQRLVLSARLLLPLRNGYSPAEVRLDSEYTTACVGGTVRLRPDCLCLSETQKWWCIEMISREAAGWAGRSTPAGIEGSGRERSLIRLYGWLRNGTSTRGRHLQRSLDVLSFLVLCKVGFCVPSLLRGWPRPPPPRPAPAASLDLSLDLVRP